MSIIFENIFPQGIFFVSTNTVDMVANNSATTISINTLCMMTISITLSIMTLTIKALSIILSIMAHDTQ